MIGFIKKMQTALESPVQYRLPVGDQLFHVNSKLGKELSIQFTGKISCLGCGTIIKKTYQQGFCFLCTKRLACCDICIVKPELCHYSKGTCREPKWGEENCLIPHYVYLSNTSGIKVGITRNTQIPTRWIDQGAVQAIPIIKVQSRYASGLVEKIIANHVDDKTNWRKLLKEEAQKVDLIEQKNSLINKCHADILKVEKKLKEKIEIIENPKVVNIQYPVNEYLEKIVSLNLDKKPEIKSKLIGIKGQYLILEIGVINMRKYTGYELEIN